MKYILTILLLAISAAAYSQKENPLYLYDTSKPRYIRWVQEASDTIPVVMLISDTTTGITEMRFGYSVCTSNRYWYPCHYLNTQKEPLPDNIIVWAATRRKP